MESFDYHIAAQGRIKYARRRPKIIYAGTFFDRICVL